jgi:hypothetical protein
MKEMTIEQLVQFFRKLDFKSKIEVLNQFTQELKKGVEQKNIDQQESSEDQVIEDLFGIWKNEEELTEESILERKEHNEFLS